MLSAFVLIPWLFKLLTLIIIGFGMFGCRKKNSKSTNSKYDKHHVPATDTSRNPPVFQTTSSKPKLPTTSESNQPKSINHGHSAAANSAQMTLIAVSGVKKDELKDRKQHDEEGKKTDGAPKEKPTETLSTKGENLSKKEDKHEDDDKKQEEKMELKKKPTDAEKKEACHNNGATRGSGDSKESGANKKNQPRIIKRDAKAQRIAEGKEKRGKGDYPTMDDVLSDWDSEKVRKKEKVADKEAGSKHDDEPKTRKTEVSKMQLTNLDDFTKEQDCVDKRSQKNKLREEKRSQADKKNDHAPEGVSIKNEVEEDEKEKP